MIIRGHGDNVKLRNTVWQTLFSSRNTISFINLLNLSVLLVLNLIVFINGIYWLVSIY